MVFKQHMMLTALAAVVCSMLMSPGVVQAQPASAKAATLDTLSKAMEAAKNPEEKRELLAEIAKIANRQALDLAAASAADEDVEKSARAAAGRIAQTLMASEQPPYIRRLAFMRWVGCLTDSQAAKPVIDALRGDDVVLAPAAMIVVHNRVEDRLLELVTREIASFPLPVQQDLMETIASRKDDSATAALLGISRHKDKKLAVTAIEALGALGGDEALARLGEVLAEADADMHRAALHGIAELGTVSQPDEAAQATLLKALNLVTANVEQQPQSEEAVVAAVQIAQTLASTHSDDVRQALQRLDACKLSKPMEQLVAGTRLLFTIDQLPNLAKGAKASSPDGFDNEGGSKGDAAAIDGNPDTYWDETDGHPLYKLRVDLPQAADISAISVSGWGHHSFSPKDFKIVCDDKTVKTVAGATYADNRLIVLFPRTRCTTVELHITGYYGGSPAVRELQIFDVP